MLEDRFFSPNSTGQEIASLILSIPTRQKFTDRKGRRRRVSIKYDLSLISGTGSLTGKAIRAVMDKELKDKKPLIIDSKRLKYITQAFKDK